MSANPQIPFDDVSGASPAPPYMAAHLGPMLVTYPAPQPGSRSAEQASTPEATAASHERWSQLPLLLKDLAYASGAAALGFFATRPLESSPDQCVRAAAVLMLYVILTLLCTREAAFYRPSRERAMRAEVLNLAKAFALSSGLVVVVAWLTHRAAQADQLIVTGSLMFGGLVLARAQEAGAVGWPRAERKRRAVIVGANACGRSLAEFLAANPQLRYDVRGFLDDSVPNNGIRVLGTTDAMRRVALAEFIDEIFVASPYERPALDRINVEARRSGCTVRIIPEHWEAIRGARYDLIGHLPAFSIRYRRGSPGAIAVKRAADVAGAVVGLIVSAPLIALAAIVVALESRGPIFYCAERIGYNGRSFRFVKLRTMHANADAEKEHLRAGNVRQGPFFKLDVDPRITRVGRILRKASVDELPQFWNVLRGEMSLVGPRPHPLDDFARYQLEHRARLSMRPGMTGLWQVTARRDPSFDVNMALDLYYIENWSLALDLKILWKTIPAVVQGTGQ